jgi:hypothetical protein
LSPEDLDAVETALDDALALIGRARPRRPDAASLLDQVRATVSLLRLSAHDARLRLAGDGSLASVPAADRRTLAGELDAVVSEHRRLWLEAFRPGGLGDSVAWFDHLGSCYRSGQADRGWFGPF